MKRIILFLSCFTCQYLFAQNSDTLSSTSKVIVHKDDRLDILGEKEAEINALATKLSNRSGMGYRLQVLSTNDRELAMKTKAQLMQKFPEQKTYIFFQLPYVKLRFGNFKTKQEAETYRTQISRMLGGASIYFVPERIEVKPDKEDEEEQ